MQKLKKLIYSFCFVCLLFGLIFSVNVYYKKFDNQNHNIFSLATLPYDANTHIYLSDLDYRDDSIVEPGYYIRKDKNGEGGLISVNTDDGKKTFIKGVAAWATSDVIYDLTDLDYDYFVSYVGVDSTQTSDYYNSGVRFTIYTSINGTDWDTVYTSGIKKGKDIAEKVTIDLKKDGIKANYLRLYAYENGDSWYSQWHDDAVYADAKLIKKDYEDKFVTSNIIKTINGYNEELNSYKDEIKSGNFTHLEDYETTLLKKEFVKRADYDILQALINYSKDYENIIKWLFSDKEALELYILGGEADGNYGTSLKVLNELYTKYHDDFNDLENGKLYKEMAITLSLTHSTSVGLWVSGAPEDPDDPNGSNAVKRYEIYKDLYLNNRLDNNIFKDLTVEEMRYVMNNVIDDEEIKWLNDYTNKNDKDKVGTKTLSQPNSAKNPYTYINYTFDYDYNKDKYYDDAQKDYWDAKVHNNSENLVSYGFKNYNLTYKTGYPKLWIVFEEGSVCGGLSKTGSNIQGVYGVPSSVISQPGHAAYIYMYKNAQGEKLWTMYNDVSGWGQSGKTEKLSVRMPNGWGSGSYAGSYPVTYILLSQSALNEYDKYKEAEEIMMTTDFFLNDYTTLTTIYNKAIEVEPINLDAYLGLIDTYKKMNASDTEYQALAEKIMINLKYYPLPMNDLLNLIINNVKNDEIKTDLINKRTNLLIADKSLNQSNVKDYNQIQAVNQVATYLLQENKPLAKFSFEDKTITLNKDYLTNPVWQYSVDSNNFSKEVSGLTYTLSDEEVDKIHEETEILIKIKGQNNVIYEIPIEKPIIPPELNYSDIDNTINTQVSGKGYSADALEYRLEGNTDWQKLSDGYDFSGNKNVEIRIGRHGEYVASDSVIFNFTAIGESDKYLYVTDLGIKDFSSEYTKTEDNSAANVLDNNNDTLWHTSWDGSDHDRYITLEVKGDPVYVTALEYVPRQGATNGIVTKAEVSTSMDGVNYTKVETTTDLEWDANNRSKYAIFTEPVKAKYVRLQALENAGDGRSFMSAAEIRLFEDSTARVMPTAEIEYSIKTETTGSVVAKLVNKNKDFTITNNNGKDTYTFTKNGSFTFTFVDEYGNKGSATATVTWIKEESKNNNTNSSTNSESNVADTNLSTGDGSKTTSTTTNKTTNKNNSSSNSNDSDTTVDENVVEENTETTNNNTETNDKQNVTNQDINESSTTTESNNNLVRNTIIIVVGIGILGASIFAIKSFYNNRD